MLSRSVALTALVLALGQSTASGQARAPSPPARAHHTIFYDDAGQRVLMTGGSAVDSRREYVLFNDLWSFDGIAWTQLPSSGDRISGARIDSDSQQQLYSFGGFRDDRAIGDLRVLADHVWRPVGVHPSVTTAEGGFVFDAARNRFVAFGGGSAGNALVSEVWEWDGRGWTQSPATPPPARGSHVMVYDARRKKVVVFGGMGVRTANIESAMLGDTWEYDGERWTRMNAVGPSPRLGAGAAFDSKRGLVILFGGADDQRAFNDLWAWDGVAWKRIAVGGPEPRVMGNIAYDKRRDRIVLFGGRRHTPLNADLSDTWEWDGKAWRRVGE